MISKSARQEALAIYEEHKDLIDHNFVCGSPWNKKVAKTIKKVAGVAA